MSADETARPAPPAPEDASPGTKLTSWDFFRSMGSPKFHVAPMVDQSELAFRELCRRHGATCAYTPMIHARLFVEDLKYRKEIFTTHINDRPLLVQFCANDPDMLLKAASSSPRTATAWTSTLDARSESPNEDDTAPSSWTTGRRSIT